MRIDVFGGSLVFDGGTIARSMNRAEFLNSPLGSQSRPLVINEPFASFGFRPEPGIDVSVQFRDSHLENVSFTLSLPDDSMENWTEAHELSRKAHHDEWLRRELGKPPYNYAWGRIVSEYYAQHCGSEVTLLYKE
jgi:hypothetical protein